jgi:hypothetical protein
MLKAPATEAVDYTWTNFGQFFSSRSIYHGIPSRELEAAWDNLSISKAAKGTNACRADNELDNAISTPVSALERLGISNRDGLILVDSKRGFASQLGVFYQLDCLV